MSTTRTPSSEKESDRPRGVMTTITERWLPFLTAGLVLATAVVGLYAARATSERDKAQDNSASLEEQVRELSDSNRELSAANKELEAENAELRRRLGEQEQPPPPSGILRETGEVPVVVPAHFGIDLDSQESNWGISPTAPSDISVSPEADTVSGKTLALVNDPPTLQDCEAQTVLKRFLTNAQTVIGQKMCVRTTEGRWAYVQIAAMDRSAETMSFKIVVWKLPTDP